jgi:Predicted sugar kinase
LDADALNAVAKNPQIIEGAVSGLVFTPHLKEFSRLTGLSVEDIKLNPVGSAVNYAKKTGVILLLKGATTTVTDGENAYLVSAGTPGMAKCGSGDVLSGILAGLYAFSKSPLLLTAACGAYINGKAGELAAAGKNEYSMLASDTAGRIAEAVSGIICG